MKCVICRRKTHAKLEKSIKIDISKINHPLRSPLWPTGLNSLSWLPVFASFGAAASGLRPLPECFRVRRWGPLLAESAAGILATCVALGDSLLDQHVKEMCFWSNAWKCILETSQKGSCHVICESCGLYDCFTNLWTIPGYKIAKTTRGYILQGLVDRADGVCPSIGQLPSCDLRYGLLDAFF